MLDQERRAIVNIIGQDNGPFDVSCTIFEGDNLIWSQRPHPNINFMVFASLIGQKMNFLSESQTAVWAGMEEPLGSAPDEPSAKSFHECVVATIKGGLDLYDTLSEIGLGDIIDHIDEMPEASHLTILTDCAFFPWEILCRRIGIDGTRLDPNGEKAYRFLWGYRFLTSYHLLSEGKSWDAPLASHRKGLPFISLNLNPTIDLGPYSRLKPMEYHTQFFNEEITAKQGELLTEGDKIIDTLMSSNNHATVIYLYCHGTNDKPFTSGALETLEVDNKKRITPDDIRNNRQVEFDRGPIIILNSCLSALQLPLSFGNFLRRFLDQRAMGILGTTINIPATFAAAFGKCILERYLNRVPIGEALYKLRRELLEKENPLGLYYSLQCPINVTAKAENSLSPTPMDSPSGATQTPQLPT